MCRRKSDAPCNFLHMARRKRGCCLGLFLLFFAFVGGASVLAYTFIKQMPAEKILAAPAVQREIRRQVGDAHMAAINNVPDFLGFNGAHTYLVLFLNNTELRPAGGFIGSYAVVHVENGHTDLKIVSGSDVLDAAADRSVLLPPPAPVLDYMRIDRWFFRDSNWSPDFSVSAAQALDFYKRENGIAAAEIDGVVGVTTDVLEDLLRLSGPVTVQGVTFTPENVIEKLEYEVEWGFAKRGVAVADRKQILTELTQIIMHRLGSSMVTRFKDYVDLAYRLAAERHVMFYSPVVGLQTKITSLDWDGAVATSTLDSVWWIDANLTALKTDHALQRALRYEVAPRADGRLVATVTMEYKHRGVFDWRTTRYRSYTRVFVPASAELVAVTGDAKFKAAAIDKGEELGRQWFGTFIQIEPGNTRRLVFSYLLPVTIGEAVKGGHYALTVQKQAGTVAHALTLHLDFGKNITSAQPGEDPKNWGNAVYDFTTDLRLDRAFTIGL